LEYVLAEAEHVSPWKADVHYFGDFCSLNK